MFTVVAVIVVYTAMVALAIWGWNRFVQRLAQEPRPSPGWTKH